MPSLLLIKIELILACIQHKDHQDAIEDLTETRKTCLKTDLSDDEVIDLLQEDLRLHEKDGAEKKLGSYFDLFEFKRENKKDRRILFNTLKKHHESLQPRDGSKYSESGFDSKQTDTFRLIFPALAHKNLTHSIDSSTVIEPRPSTPSPQEAATPETASGSTEPSQHQQEQKDALIKKIQKEEFFHRSIEEIEIFINKDETLVNIQDYMGSSFLIEAIRKGNSEFALFLLNKGADANSCNKYLDRPLHLAIKATLDKTLLETLISKGADVNVKDRDGKTALAVAIDSGNQQAMKLLVKKRANINGEESIEINIDRPIHSAMNDAMEDEDFFAIKLLLQKGANPFLKNSAGMTAFDLAQKLNPNDDDCKRVLKLLAEAQQTQLKADSSTTTLKVAAQLPASNSMTIPPKPYIRPSKNTALTVIPLAGNQKAPQHTPTSLQLPTARGMSADIPLRETHPFSSTSPQIPGQGTKTALTISSANAATLAATYRRITVPGGAKDTPRFTSITRQVAPLPVLPTTTTSSSLTPASSTTAGAAKKEMNENERFAGNVKIFMTATNSALNRKYSEDEAIDYYHQNKKSPDNKEVKKVSPASFSAGITSASGGAKSTQSFTPSGSTTSDSNPVTLTEKEDPKIRALRVLTSKITSYKKTNPTASDEIAIQGIRSNLKETDFLSNKLNAARFSNFDELVTYYKDQQAK